MTAYQIAIEMQSLFCSMAERSIEDLDAQELSRPTVAHYERMMRRDIDRAYVLGLMIDSMPVELAEREV